MADKKKLLDAVKVKNCSFSRQKGSQTFQCTKSVLADSLTLCPRMSGNHEVPKECPYPLQ